MSRDNPAAQKLKGVPLSEIASDIPLRKQWLSEHVASEVLRLFRLSVVAIVALTIALAALDAWFLYKGVIDPSERLVTEKVLMAIIGASIIQVGAAFATIVLALFRKSEADAD